MNYNLNTRDYQASTTLSLNRNYFGMSSASNVYRTGVAPATSLEYKVSSIADMKIEYKNFESGSVL